jgi:sulfonate transport system ATP-binding protein
MSSGLPLEIRQVSRAFGAKQVLRGVDLAIRPGEFTVIVGRSGCGKSTLLRIIAGLDRPDSGSVLLDGKPSSGLDPRVRIVFQEHRLLPWKRVLANVTIGARTLESRARGVLDHVGLAEHERDWPSTLSGGQKQRVALARALLTEPQLLLFDEPLGALDALTRCEMQELVERLWLEQKFTAFFITHDVEEAVALADRVIVIESGAVTLDLPVDLPRPRNREAEDFGRIKAAVRERLMSKAPGS